MPHATLTPLRALDAARDKPDEPPQEAGIVVRLAPGLQREVDCTWIAARLGRAADIIMSSSNLRVTSVGALIVDDRRMVELHQRHSGIATTTDVLTFDLREHPSDPIAADLVICADEAGRRAAEFSHSIERELLLYCVHGLLHCAGEGDHDEAHWRRMHAREDEILAAIGVGATFSRDPNPGSGEPKEDHTH